MESKISSTLALLSAPLKQPENEGSACKPWSRKDFQSRIRTFKFNKWKNSTSPLECARAGWICTALDTLYCNMCKVTLKKEEENDDFIKRLNTAHKDLCPWRHNSSPSTFAEIPIYSLDSFIKDTTLRIHTLLTSFRMGKLRLPQIQQDLKKDVEVLLEDEKTASALLKPLEEEKERVAIEGDQKIALVCLALTGWTTNEDKQSGALGSVITCECCQRDIGLWNFASLRDQNESKGDETLVESASGEAQPAKRRKVAPKSELNCLSEHLWFCPWKTSWSNILQLFKRTPDEAKELSDPRVVLKLIHEVMK